MEFGIIMQIEHRKGGCDMQINTKKLCENANINMQNLLQHSKESNIKLEKPTFFDTPAAEVSFSKEAMAALRDQQNQSGYMGYIESREWVMAEGTRYWIDNEIELEHYFTMREMSAQTLRDGNYDVKDLMASMMETYETMYNQILEAHKDGDRQFVSEITGTRSITLEEDLKALDTAFQWRLSDLEGYITCQQTNDGSKFFGSVNMKADEAERKEYRNTAISIIEQAKEKLKKMYEQTDYKKGIGKNIIWNMMNSNIFFIEKTQQLFARTIKNA